jgi:hypothetical protein
MTKFIFVVKKIIKSIIVLHNLGVHNPFHKHKKKTDKDENMTLMLNWFVRLTVVKILNL